MTVSNQTNKIQYDGNGSTTVFPIPFTWQGNSEISVILTTIATGVETTLTITTDYTLSGGSGSSGSMTTVATYSSAYRLTIIREVALTQDTEYTPYGINPAEVTENALDKLTQITQQIQEEVVRSVKTQVGSTVGGITLINPLPGSLLQYGLDGKTIVSTDTTVSSGSYILPFNGAVQRSQLAKNAEIVSVKDFGAVGDGVTDDTVAIQAAFAISSGKTISFPPGTYIISSPIDLRSNSQVILDQGAEIRQITASQSNFIASAKDNIIIRGGKISATQQGVSGVPAGVLLAGSENCTVENVEFEGMQLSGVYLSSSNKCKIINNYFYDPNNMTSVGADTAAVNVLFDSNDNLISGNVCIGTTAVGISVQGAAATTYPLRNKVVNNWVFGAIGYGILVYQITAADTWTLVSGNTVEDIVGTHVSGASGSGIYYQTSGGGIISNNTIRNCCISTTSSANAPAGISAASNGAARETIIIEGNHIDAPKWYGIFLGDASGKFICTGNRIRYADAANGVGILMIDSSNTIVSKNYITASASLARPAITTIAQTTNITNITFSDNVVDGSDGVLYNFTRASTYTISGVITGNTARSTGANAQAMSLFGLSNAVVSNNLLAAGFIGLYITSCTNVRGSGNNCIGSGGLRLLTAGTNANVYFDSTNDFNTADTANIQNQAVGVAIEQRLNSSPSGGTWQVGDRIVQTVPVVGQPKAWSCTVAGAPGTWVSEGNL